LGDFGRIVHGRVSAHAHKGDTEATVGFASVDHRQNDLFVGAECHVV
jgi:hypothetical protein